MAKKTKKVKKTYLVSWAPYGDKSDRNYGRYSMDELTEMLRNGDDDGVYADLRTHEIDAGTPVKVTVTITGIK